MPAIYRTGVPLLPTVLFLYIQSTNIFNYFFLDFLSPSSFIPPQNVVYFLMLTFLVYGIFTFYINCVLNCKCPVPGPKGYIHSWSSPIILLRSSTVSSASNHTSQRAMAVSITRTDHTRKQVLTSNASHFCLISIKFEFDWRNSVELPYTKTSHKCIQRHPGCAMRTDGRTDVKLTVAVCNRFANALKNKMYRSVLDRSGRCSSGDGILLGFCTAQWFNVLMLRRNIPLPSSGWLNSVQVAPEISFSVIQRLKLVRPPIISQKRYHLSSVAQR